MKLKDKLIRFMYGRYGGADSLGKALMWSYLILLFLGALLGLPILMYPALLIFVYYMYRVFSRNITARQKENTAFVRCWSKLALPFKRIKDKEHVYRRCPHCRATVRLPKKKGKHTVCCPACHTDFGVKI